MRSVAGDLAEEVKLIDDFTHPKTVGGGQQRWDGYGELRGERSEALSAWGGTGTA